MNFGRVFESENANFLRECFNFARNCVAFVEKCAKTLTNYYYLQNFKNVADEKHGATVEKHFLNGVL